MAQAGISLRQSPLPCGGDGRRLATRTIARMVPCTFHARGRTNLCQRREARWFAQKLPGHLEPQVFTVEGT